MALLTCDLFSESLEVGTSVTVVLPQATTEQIGVDASDGQPGDGFPVLYLLHGLSDDHSAWTRYTSIERYAAAAGLAVVMPSVGRSFYSDEVHGHHYWQWVSQELPEVVASFFRVSTRPEDTFVAGLSMGGYGALKLGLSHPGRYAAVASLSGVADLRHLLGRPERQELVERVFGGDVTGAADTFALLETVDPADRPPLYVACGTEEGDLTSDNVRFADRAEVLGFDVTRDFRPGTHEWGLWDDVIQDVIAWLPVPGRTTA